MVAESVWLIFHKAALNSGSLMNEDGSTFMLGVGVVPASDIREAMDKFDAYLVQQKMSIIDLWKCEKWDAKHFPEDSLESRQINGAAERALASDKIYYTCGISSEAL